MYDELVPPDNLECLKVLISLKWPDGYACSFCGSEMYWIKPDRRLIICKKCRKEVSPLAGTMFHRSRINLNNWFEIIRLMTCSPDKVITAKYIFRVLGLGSYRTAWNALNKARFAISFNEKQSKLNGVIEFDEIVITGIESEYSKVSILGAIELEGEKRLSLTMIRNPDEMNIKYYFRKNFARNVLVVTDPEKLYIRNWLELNRIKELNKEKYEKAFLNLHIILQDIRYGLRCGHHSVSEKFLQRNLDEYVFVFNNERPEAFRKLLKYMMITPYSTFIETENKKRSFLSIIRGHN